MSQRNTGHENRETEKEYIDRQRTRVSQRDTGHENREGEKEHRNIEQE